MVHHCSALSDLPSSSTVWCLHVLLLCSVPQHCCDESVKSKMKSTEAINAANALLSMTTTENKDSLGDSEILTGSREELVDYMNKHPCMPSATGTKSYFNRKPQKGKYGVKGWRWTCAYRRKEACWWRCRIEHVPLHGGKEMKCTLYESNTVHTCALGVEFQQKTKKVLSTKPMEHTSKVKMTVRGGSADTTQCNGKNGKGAFSDSVNSDSLHTDSGCDAEYGDSGVDEGVKSSACGEKQRKRHLENDVSCLGDTFESANSLDPCTGFAERKKKMEMEKDSGQKGNSIKSTFKDKGGERRRRRKTNEDSVKRVCSGTESLEDVSSTNSDCWNNSNFDDEESEDYLGHDMSKRTTRKRRKKTAKVSGRNGTSIKSTIKDKGRERCSGTESSKDDSSTPSDSCDESSFDDGEGSCHSGRDTSKSTTRKRRKKTEKKTEKASGQKRRRRRKTYVRCHSNQTRDQVTKILEGRKDTTTRTRSNPWFRANPHKNKAGKRSWYIKCNAHARYVDCRWTLRIVDGVKPDMYDVDISTDEHCHSRRDEQKHSSSLPHHVKTMVTTYLSTNSTLTPFQIHTIVISKLLTEGELKNAKQLTRSRVEGMCHRYRRKFPSAQTEYERLTLSNTILNLTPLRVYSKDREDKFDWETDDNGHPKWTKEWSKSYNESEQIEECWVPRSRFDEAKLETNEVKFTNHGKIAALLLPLQLKNKMRTKIGRHKYIVLNPCFSCLHSDNADYIHLIYSTPELLSRDGPVRAMDHTFRLLRFDKW